MPPAKAPITDRFGIARTASTPSARAKGGGTNIKSFSMVPMQKQRFYVEDTFGLRTMDEQGRLTLTAVDGVSHTEWHDSEDLFIKYFDPILQ
eukprot:m51a1_g2287 hypothetical protein (92) ;mRNA; f:402051-404750